MIGEALELLKKTKNKTLQGGSQQGQARPISSGVVLLPSELPEFLMAQTQ